MWTSHIDDIINGIITSAIADEPVEGLYVDNGQVVDADCAFLGDDTAGVIRALLGRSPTNPITLFVSPKTVPVTNASTRGALSQYVTPATQRYLVLNPNLDAALPYGASSGTNFTADLGESGAVATWRWPLDSGLRTSEVLPAYYDVSQVNFVLNGNTATTKVVTPFCAQFPLFALQVYITQSGWSNSPSTSNVAHFQGSGITVPAITASGVGLIYDSLPQGVIHIAVGWRDYNGTQQHAYMKVNPFTSSANERCRITMLFGSKTVPFNSVTNSTDQNAYFSNLNRSYCPAKLSPGYLTDTGGTTTTSITQEYTAGVTTGLTTTNACGYVTVRCLYEGPENNITLASSSQYNPVTVRIVLRPLADIQHHYATNFKPCEGKARRPSCPPPNVLGVPVDGNSSLLATLPEPPPPTGGSPEVVYGPPPSSTPACPNCANISPKPVTTSTNTGARGGTFHSF